MMVFKSKKKGLKIMIKCARTVKDADGNYSVFPSEVVQFHDFRYVTSDPKHIEVIKKYMESNQGEIECISQDELDAIKALRNAQAAKLNAGVDTAQVKHNRKIVIRDESK